MVWHNLKTQVHPQSACFVCICVYRNAHDLYFTATEFPRFVHAVSASSRALKFSSFGRFVSCGFVEQPGLKAGLFSDQEYII